MKKCNTCLVEKELENFSKDSRNKDGLNGECKPCRSAKMRAARKDNPEKFREYDRTRWDKRKVKTLEWREKNREKYNATMREYQKLNYDRLRLNRYNLTVEQYNELIEEQNKKCAICSKETEKLVIDHNHKTGKVRKLLCYNCNRGMHYIDDEVLLLNMIQYKKDNE